MHGALPILLTLGVLLSGCSTLTPVYEGVVDGMPWQSEDEGVNTMRSDYISEDLITHFGDGLEPYSKVTIVTKESDEWGSLEDNLREKGYAVGLEKRRRNAGKNPVIYTITDIVGGTQTHGVLLIDGLFRLSRIYYVGDDYVINKSPVSVLVEEDNE